MCSGMGDNRLKTGSKKRAQSSDTHVAGRGIWSKAITTLLSPRTVVIPLFFVGGGQWVGKVPLKITTEKWKEETEARKNDNKRT